MTRLARIDSQVGHLEEIQADLQAKIQEQIAAASGLSTLPAGPMSAPSAAGLIWPLDGLLTSGFGGRDSPGGVGSTNHEGIDIAVPEGTPIRAAKGGTVIIASYNGGYGNYTCIDHGGGLSTCYGHQSAFAVTSGQSVDPGPGHRLLRQYRSVDRAPPPLRGPDQWGRAGPDGLPVDVASRL